MFFGWARDKIGQKCQYLAQNDQECINWAKFGRLWAKKGTLFFAQLFPVVARTWIELRSVFFLGPKSRLLAQKSNSCHTTPFLVDGPFVALGETVHIPCWERFFDISFLSYGCFLKKAWSTRQKLFPLPTGRALSASNSPSALSARARQHSLNCFEGLMQANSPKNKYKCNTKHWVNDFGKCF